MKHPFRKVSRFNSRFDAGTHSKRVLSTQIDYENLEASGNVLGPLSLTLSLLSPSNLTLLLILIPFNSDIFGFFGSIGLFCLGRPSPSSQFQAILSDVL